MTTNPVERERIAREPFKYQAQYDALNWWHKFLFSQNSHNYIIMWQREEIAKLEARLAANPFYYPNEGNPQ